MVGPSDVLGLRRWWWRKRAPLASMSRASMRAAGPPAGGGASGRQVVGSRSLEHALSTDIASGTHRHGAARGSPSAPPLPRDMPSRSRGRDLVLHSDTKYLNGQSDVGPAPSCSPRDTRLERASAAHIAAASWAVRGGAERGLRHLQCASCHSAPRHDHRPGSAAIR